MASLGEDKKAFTFPLSHNSGSVYLVSCVQSLVLNQFGKQVHSTGSRPEME